MLERDLPSPQQLLQHNQGFLQQRLNQGRRRSSVQGFPFPHWKFPGCTHTES
ncbi:hypothetical protein LINPERPRIM_LOCUS40940 [Linum perenne]